MASGRFYTTFTGFVFYGIPFIVAAVTIGPVLAIVAVGNFVVRSLRLPSPWTGTVTI